MRQRILIFLAVIGLFSLSGAAFSIYLINHSSEELRKLVNLHQIEDLRKSLISSVQSVQSDLYTIRTNLGQTLDRIVADVETLGTSSERCSGCHHEPAVAAELDKIREMITQYEITMSAYITVSANEQRIDRLKLDAAGIGNQILDLTERMSHRASKKLEERTSYTLANINTAQNVLYATIFFTICMGAVAAFLLSSSITIPVKKLLDATREMTMGNLGATVEIRDRTEIGELARNFNLMSIAMKDGFVRLEKEIDERKRTSGELRRSERFLNSVFDSIRDPFCIFDRDYRIIRANEAYADLKRKDIKELIGQICYSVLCDRQDICDDCLVRKSYFSGDTCAKEKLVTGQDGIETWLEIYTYPVRNDAGEVTHMIEYIRDITERKRSEVELRVSRERYALAAQGANDGLWDWDFQSNRVYYSPRWKSMLGYGDSEVGDTPGEWLDRIHADDRKKVETKMWAHINGQLGHFACEFRIKKKGGDYAWALSRGLVVRDADGTAYRMAGSQTDITSQKHAEMQLLHDAFHDILTGLPNRALFIDRLNQSIRHAARASEGTFSVLFLDLDRFKVINDSLGHPVGDQLLVAFGSRVAGCVRAEDTVARFGGDEFAILLEGAVSFEDVFLVVERLQSEIPKPLEIGEHTITTTASIGIVMDTKGYTTGEQVLRDADIALYQAKQKGRARYEIFDTKMHSSVISRLQLEGDFRNALERNEFVLNYQPIIDLGKSKTIGYEALIRWNHPVRGVLGPMEFIPLAEETGMIGQIGDWILREGCHQLSVWQRQYPSDPPLKLSVNISARQFSKVDLADRVSEILLEYRVPPSSLALEVTESILIENAEIAGEQLRRLRDMGVHIHIDDFGTGYSSLSYIHELPVTALKIDRSFINRVVDTPEKYEIVKTIITLAESLGLDVIAEGVEEHDQLEHIKQLRCRYGQGYLFARPMKQEDAEVWLRGENGSGKDVYSQQA